MWKRGGQGRAYEALAEEVTKVVKVVEEVFFELLVDPSPSGVASEAWLSTVLDPGLKVGPGVRLAIEIDTGVLLLLVDLGSSGNQQVGLTSSKILLIVVVLVNFLPFIPVLA